LIPENDPLSSKNKKQDLHYYSCESCSNNDMEKVEEYLNLGANPDVDCPESDISTIPLAKELFDETMNQKDQ
jgi:hypothetical protein